jgi:hypothetical protein
MKGTCEEGTEWTLAEPLSSPGLTLGGPMSAKDPEISVEGGRGTGSSLPNSCVGPSGALT